jgi:hypothetical protein
MINRTNVKISVLVTQRQHQMGIGVEGRKKPY